MARSAFWQGKILNLPDPCCLAEFVRRAGRAPVSTIRGLSRLTTMAAMTQVIDVADLASTQRLGRKLAALLPRGSVVALNGPLGAGKTHFVQAVADGSGIDPADVTSPTFVLLQEYVGNPSIFHFDVYRLKDEDEFLQLGPEEYFDGDGLCLIEWADKVKQCLPQEYLQIDIEVTGEKSRRFTVTANGESYEWLLPKLAVK